MMTFALFGQPVSGSLSPVMHNAAFAAAGLAARYEAVEVAPAELPGALAAARRPGGYAGLNLTAPLKEAGLALCDSASPLARAAGAVNTIRFLRGLAHGDNTDLVALWSVIHEWRGAAPAEEGERGPDLGVAILGTGGVARAAAVAAVLAGASRVTLFGRTRGRPAGVAADLRRRIAAELGRGDPAETDRLLPGVRPLRDGCRLEGLALAAWASPGPRPPRVFGVVVQATSAPDPAVRLGSASRLGRPGGVAPLAVELRYRPPRTAFLTEAASAGARLVDGIEILWRQGEEAFRLFTGVRPPSGVMARVLAEAIGGGPGAASGDGR